MMNKKIPLTDNERAIRQRACLENLRETQESDDLVKIEALYRKRCLNCNHWNPKTLHKFSSDEDFVLIVGDGECRRLGPSIAPSIPREEFEKPSKGVWAITSSVDWCGQFVEGPRVEIKWLLMHGRKL